MDHQHRKIQQFYKLLCEWQRQFSLKSLVEPSHFLHHVADMECVATHIQEPVLAELGAGVGLNIFLLAMLCPTRQFIAIEKHNKRRGWMQIQRQALALGNVEIEINFSDLSRTPPSPTGLLLKAFSPRSQLPKLLEQSPSSVVSVYVVEGGNEGLSPLIPKSYFVESQTIQMTHGQQRQLKIFKRVSVVESSNRV